MTNNYKNKKTMKKTLFISICFFVAFSSFLISCDENEDLNRCKITVTCTDGGKVKISKYIETSEFVLIGSEIEVVATPNDGYAFTGWYVADSTEPISTDAVFTFVATKNTTLTAHFTKRSVVTICSAGNGSVSFKDSTDTSVAVLPGCEVTVIATPNNGYAFTGWYVAEAETPVSTDAEYTFTVNEDIVLTAKFKFCILAKDLGLPSGTKWANCNVGATTPEEYGGYYAWGETEEKDNYAWSTYKWFNGSYDTMTKYCINIDNGTVDNKTVLDPDDDVAHVKWGGNWRMPTKAEQDELRNNCTWTWTTQSGVNGYKVTSNNNGNSIFLPAAGYRAVKDLRNIGSRGYYWSSLLYDDRTYYAYRLCFYSDNFDWDYNYIFYGLSVRPVSE